MISTFMIYVQIHTSDGEMEGEGLLADAGVDVSHDAKVRVVGVSVVHACNVELPVGHHDQLQSCKKVKTLEISHIDTK